MQLHGEQMHAHYVDDDAMCILPTCSETLPLSYLQYLICREINKTANCSYDWSPVVGCTWACTNACCHAAQSDHTAICMLTAGHLAMGEAELW